MNSALQPRAEAVTQAVFDRLPALLTRAQFLLVTGLSRRDLEDMTATGEIVPWRGRQNGYRKWRKTDAAKICKFKL